MLSMLRKWFRRTPVPAVVRTPVAALYARANDAAAAEDFPRAIDLYDQVIAIDPSHAEACYKRGNAFKNLVRLDEALASYDRAIALKSDFAYAYCNRGVVQQSLGQLDAALASYARAIACDPLDAITHYNRALALQDLGRWDEALADYERAITIDAQYADAQFNRSLALLFRGDFARGLPAFEWRWKNAQRLGLGRPRNFSQPLWLGEESVSGKRLLLYSEGGLGDTLQFCRYVSLAAARGATVWLEVQPALAGLLQNLEGASGVFGTGSALPPFDLQCPLMSLPLAFKTTLETIPAPPKYLHAEFSKVAEWRAALGDRTRPLIGLAWSGNPNNAIDHRRSIRLADWISHLPNEFAYVCLQKEVRPADREILATNAHIMSLDGTLSDFPTTAAVCDCLDLVVSVDTSVAHLSAALGKPTWVLLPVNPDWRWLQHGGRSPWYPSMRLHRQSVAGDWHDVLVRVSDDLRRHFRSG